MVSDNIKIAVRVRPFNSFQEDQKCVIQMNQDILTLTGGLENRQFKFHRCFWSHDQTQPYTNNIDLFNDFGKQILTNAYQGYNSTIFAYGQTGSGKSYSIQGLQGKQKGILQLCCEQMFNVRFQENKENRIQTTVQVSYLQIYNQKLRDLLNPNSKELKIFSSGSEVFVQNLSHQSCNSYPQIQKVFNQGKRIRMVGAHNLNKNSSRSHTVFTITYTQKVEKKIKKAKINIVDLAGSQRSSKTGAAGIRLQQANNINKSLTNLGIVIQTLANNSNKKQKQFVAYRNSQLTYILSQSLGGNSKTLMIAAVSPAKSNYQQTLSTLRFAQRVACIVTNSKKNVTTQNQINSDLLKQIQRLKQELQKEKNNIKLKTQIKQVTVQKQIQKANPQTQQKLSVLMMQLERNKNMLLNAQQRLKINKINNEQMENARKKALADAGVSYNTYQNQQQQYPYLISISDDPSLAGIALYLLKQKKYQIGTNQVPENKIKMNSLGIKSKHCVIYNQQNKNIYIEPFLDCYVAINGTQIKQRQKVEHLDRITIGTNNAFKLVIPGGKIPDKKKNQSQQIMYGRFKKDSQERKNIQKFTKQLKERIPHSYNNFVNKINKAFEEIDQANQYTNFRYHKFPLSTRYIYFHLQLMIDFQYYGTAQPTFVVSCRKRINDQIQFIWSYKKFDQRLQEMYVWYSDVDTSNQKEKQNSQFIQFDPWFEITDEYIRQKQYLNKLSFVELKNYYVKKSKYAANNYQKLITEQKKLSNYLIKTVFKNDDQIQEYADFFFRHIAVSQQKIQKYMKIKQNKKIHQIVQRYIQTIAQSRKLTLDIFDYNKKINKMPQNKNINQVQVKNYKKLLQDMKNEVNYYRKQNKQLNQFKERMLSK